MAEEKDRKKHPASRAKLRRARKKGQVVFSRQASSSVAWITGAMVALLGVRSMGSELVQMIRTLWGSGHTELSGVESYALSVLEAIAPCALAAAGSCLLVGFFQVRAPMKLRMHWNRLNPFKGLKRLFSARRLTDLCFVLLRIFLLLLAGTLWFAFNWSSLLLANDLEQGLALVWHDLAKLLVLLGLVGVLGGLLDWWVQRRRFLRDQRMTDEELKRERKDQDGDPALKAERRRRHRRLLADTGMGALARAKVVIVNPTHVAVALRYEASEDEAPVVLVSGWNERAMRIRSRAMALGVPVVEQVQLARALVSLDEGELVPEAQYEAVAEVIRLVQSMA